MIYLDNIDRTDADADSIITYLSKRIGLSICPKSFDTIISHALSITWTRDPFDRILVAHASVDNDILITRDELIREHYAHAQW